MVQNNITVKEEEETVDLLELWGVLKKKIGLILLIAVLGAGLFGGVSKFYIKPTYTASATLYIFDQTTNITSLNDLQMGTQLASDFTVLATSEPVVCKMIETLNLEEDYEDVVKKIEAVNETNTRLIKLSVEDHSAEKASEMANALADALVVRVTEIMETSHAYVAVPSSVPKKPSSPNVARNAIIGGLLGGLLVAGITTVRFITDDTVKTGEDVEKYLGLVTLAEMPIEYSADVPKKKKNKKAKYSI